MTEVLGTGIRILIIDDYKIVRIGLRTLFNEDDAFEVVGEAEDGETGVAFSRHFKPDVAIVDLGLPDISGIEVIQKIKGIHPDIKIIVLTSHEETDDVTAALQAGANAYCLKDIPSPRLLEVVRVVAEGGAWLDPAIAKVAFKIFSRIESAKALHGHVGAIGDFCLTAREREVLHLLVSGSSNTEIAEQLFVSVHTVKAHVGSILQKLCVSDRVQAAVKAIAEGLVRLERP